MEVEKLTVEQAVDPVGLGERTPRFSWAVAGDRPGLRPVAYQVQVRSDGAPIWDSGQVERPDQVLVEYDGEPLRSRQRCEWRVRVWDEQGEASRWSDPATFEMGLLSAGDWGAAQWIGPAERPARAADRPSPLLRTAFSLDGPIACARLYISALGLYEAALNGGTVGDDRLRPGFTAYDRRIQYQVYDVTPLLAEGPNVIGVTLADGWWRGRVGVFRRPNNWGREVAAIVRLEVELGDGSLAEVVSDQAWRTAHGGTLRSCLFHGETFDARAEPRGWAEAGFDDAGWARARVIAAPRGELVAQVGPSVRPVARVKADRIIDTPSGERVVDFGQNLAGVTAFSARGAPGEQVVLTHGETLDGNGNFAPDTFGPSKQQVRYVLRGDPDGERFEPRFTYHGFRYARIDEWPAGPEPAAGDFEAVALSSDTPVAGSFTCSHDGLNRLVRNIEWSQRSNMVDIPTDCPTREKAGWTGDIAMFARTGVCTSELGPLLTRWLADVRADQFPDGRIPCVVPVSASYNAPFMRPTHGAAAWADACVLVPWTLYEFYGDRRVLDDNYATMTAWVRALERRAARDPWWRKLARRPSAAADRRHLIEQGFQWAEWLPPGESLTRNWVRGLLKPDPLVATAFYANTLRVVGDVARIIGRDRDAARLHALRGEVVAAVRSSLFEPDGLPARRDQVGLVAALAFDLVEPARRDHAAAALADQVRLNGSRLATGFTMTPRLCPTLADTGFVELAYDVLLAEHVPSWLYPLSKDATTTWETWDAIAPDGSVADVSQNHYAFGAVGEFLHRYVAGLDTDPSAPGFEHVVIRPTLDPAGRLTHARSEHLTARGPVRVSWRQDADAFHLETSIPPGSTATVTLPRDNTGRQKVVDLESGHHAFSVPQRGRH